MLKDESARPSLDEAVEPEQERGRVLACRRCHRPITTTAARVEIDGAAVHVFTNPAGLSFRIGCFSPASGLSPVGPASFEWTWFPGCSWQIEICGQCDRHIGWLYRGREHTFHGLLLDRLLEVDEE